MSHLNLEGTNILAGVSSFLSTLRSARASVTLRALTIAVILQSSPTAFDKPVRAGVEPAALSSDILAD